MDGPEWESHEFWKMRILSMHKDHVSGNKWVVGTWFYSPSQLRDIKLKERYLHLSSLFSWCLFYFIYRNIIPHMGNTELVLSTHRDVINPSCIQCMAFLSSFSLFENKVWLAKMNIHYFDDNDPLQHLIPPSSWFYRFTLTWKGSLEPTTSFGALKVVFLMLLYIIFICI